MWSGEQSIYISERSRPFIKTERDVRRCKTNKEADDVTLFPRLIRISISPRDSVYRFYEYAFVPYNNISILSRILLGEHQVNEHQARSLLTLVHPVRYSVINTAEHAGVGDLVVIGHFRLRPVVNVVLVHVNQAIAAWCPDRELQRRRLVRRQHRLHSAADVTRYNVIATRFRQTGRIEIITKSLALISADFPSRREFLSQPFRQGGLDARAVSHLPFRAL